MLRSRARPLAPERARGRMERGVSDLASQRFAELLESVWGSRGDLATRTVDMAVANLRRKIERDPAQPRIIQTVRGVGYAWIEEKEPS